MRRLGAMETLQMDVHETGISRAKKDAVNSPANDDRTNLFPCIYKDWKILTLVKCRY